MAHMDIFGSSAFNMMSLTAALLDVPYVPGRLGQLGVYEENSVATTSVSIEKDALTLALVPTTRRGSDPTPNVPGLRSLRNVNQVRLAMRDRIMADEIQNVRAFGSETALKAMQSEVNRRLGDLARKLDATLEWHRMGALKGILYDSDGTTALLNMYTLFGGSQTVRDFDLDNTSPVSGAVRTSCSVVIRAIEDELGALGYTSIHALCGTTFWDQLVAHKEVRETFLYQQGAALRERSARREVFYGGITFEEYRGNVSGQAFVAAGDAYIFPIGAAGCFLTRFGPADYMDSVNTMGLPRYARQYADPTGADRFRDLEAQTNVIHLNTRPKVVVKGTNT